MPPGNPFKQWLDAGTVDASDYSLSSHTHPGGSGLHEDLTDVTSDQHHPQSHSHGSHTGIGATDHHSNANDHVRAHVVAEALDHTFPGGSTFLRADGAWANPPGGSEAFPVGAVFLALVATNPASLLGYGTWAAFGAGRMLVGLNAGDADFDTVRETGGAKTHGHGDNLSHAGTAVAAHVFTQPSGHSAHAFTQPTAHGDHTGVPSHVHVQSLPSGQTGSQASGTRDTSTTGSVADALSTAANTGAANQVHTNNHAGGAVDAHSAHAGGAVDAHGVTQPNAHGAHAAVASVPPYIVVYMWERTA